MEYSAEELYKINITDYIESYDEINNKIFYKFYTDCNHDNNYLKNFCLLTSIGNSHYNLL